MRLVAYAWCQARFRVQWDALCGATHGVPLCGATHGVLLMVCHTWCASHGVPLCGATHGVLLMVCHSVVPLMVCTTPCDACCTERRTRGCTACCTVCCTMALCRMLLRMLHHGAVPCTVLCLVQWRAIVPGVGSLLATWHGPHAPGLCSLPSGDGSRPLVMESRRDMGLRWRACRCRLCAALSGCLQPCSSSPAAA